MVTAKAYSYFYEIIYRNQWDFNSFVLRVRHYIRSLFRIRNDIFNYENIITNAKQTSNVVSHTQYKGVKIPLISIDDFVKVGIGLCRHHALATAYMIDCLLNEEKPLIQGTVQHIRGNL